MTKQHRLRLLTGWKSTLCIPLASIGPPSWWRREFCGFDHHERPSGVSSKSTSTEMVIGWIISHGSHALRHLYVQCTIGSYLSNRPPTPSIRTKTLHRHSRPPEPSLYPSRGLHQQNLSLIMFDHVWSLKLLIVHKIGQDFVCLYNWFCPCARWDDPNNTAVQQRG